MVFRWMFSAEYSQYMLLSQQHDDLASKVLKTHNRRLRLWQSILALSAIFLCSNTVSYYCGRYGKSEFDSGMLSEIYTTHISMENQPLMQWTGPAGRDERVFEYNRTFSIAPTLETDEAWKALFPGLLIHVGGGQLTL